MKILAVDDDPVFLELLIVMLRSLGFENLTTATSGQDALSLLDQTKQPFDCLLLDIQMPGMNGVQLCGAVRGIDAYKRTPILMVTAMSAKNYVDDAFAAGATDYVTKPLDRLDLKARLGMAVRLCEERQRMAAFVQQTESLSLFSDLSIDFSTPIVLPGVDRSVEYLAMENYLLTLGATRLYTIGAFAIKVENAGLIYSKASPLAFVNMLGDVATAILDGLKTEQIMLSYAGNGNFVVLVQRNSLIDPEELSTKIDLSLADFTDIYVSDRIPTPRICVGSVVRGSIFAPTRPTRILDQAIDSTQKLPSAKSGTRGIAA
jgi:CheY-like chemotaxis protein